MGIPALLYGARHYMRMRIPSTCPVGVPKHNMLESHFQPLAETLGIAVDKARYVLLVFASLPIAMVFRHLLHPSHVSLTVRHTVSIIIGLTWAVICFDWDVFILLGVVAVSYILLHVRSPSVVQRYTMVWVMGTMSIAHLYRTLTDFGGYRLDFSGPLMILVQKLSLVAFAVHDGRGGNPHPLNRDQEQNKLESIPSLLEYLSYTLNFHTILAGPSVTMREHLDFMDGTNLVPLDNPNQFAMAKQHSKVPSALYPVVSKLILSLAALFGYLSLTDYGVHLVLEPSYGFMYRLYILYVVSLQIKCGYYFIWFLSDCVNNAAGLGFSGYDSKGNAQWDLATNIFILDMEFAMNLRTVANSWNVTTSRWLRRVCFERVKSYPAILTFLLSAFWHGFYPGYYASLMYLAFALEAAKKMRRLLNPFFTSQGLVVRWSYHLVTMFLAQMYALYGAVALHLMWLPEVYVFWRSFYFIPLWTSFIALAILPSRRPPKGHTQGAAPATARDRTALKLHKQD